MEQLARMPWKDPVAVAIAFGVLIVCFAVACLVAWARGRALKVRRRLQDLTPRDAARILSRARAAWPPGTWPMNRERLGRIAREAWSIWAARQPEVKATWLTPWGDLSPAMQEADRCIAQAVAHVTLAEIAANVNKWCGHAQRRLAGMKQAGADKAIRNGVAGEIFGLERVAVLIARILTDTREAKDKAVRA